MILFLYGVLMATTGTSLPSIYEYSLKPGRKTFFDFCTILFTILFTILSGFCTCYNSSCTAGHFSPPVQNWTCPCCSVHLWAKATLSVKKCWWLWNVIPLSKQSVQWILSPCFKSTAEVFALLCALSVFHSLSCKITPGLMLMAAAELLWS